MSIFYKFASLFACWLVFSNIALAYNCPITPEIWELRSPPNHFHKTNNLRKKVGSSVSAKGKPILITGKITDKHCTPIPNAIIRIWHKNHNGIYEHEKGHWHKKDSNFYGSGSANTDNLGRYSFFTIMPGVSEGQPSNITFSVAHRDFYNIETKLFFAENISDTGNAALLRLASVNDIKMLTRSGESYMEYQKYDFDIALDGKIWYR